MSFVLLILILLAAWFVMLITPTAFVMSIVSLVQGAKCGVGESKWLGVAGLACVVVSLFAGGMGWVLSLSAFAMAIVGCRSVGTSGMAMPGSRPI